ncbi:sporulation integral membrane protein YtvI [Intestinimonas massiliensis (ex Afouda et al. 2020)]|uniref:sporulation integral membrane protein YtvI n=1 Tax=Intestinimonas massiliensis (ex Afouda et al. 2020) TaxID=1673721 RepID=UPI0010325A9C|nr:sporulation integral membrane protein YtvI [Intestinimonas massiliensis (ex Afouda et al. 2020)]
MAAAENRHLRFLLRLTYAALLAGGLWLAGRVLLPWLLPFLAALGLSALLEPCVRFLIRRLRMGRRWAAGLCTAALAGGLAAAAGLLLWRGWYELTVLLGRLPQLMSGLPELAGELESWLYRFLVALPLPAQEPVKAALDHLMEQGAGLPARLYERLTTLLGNAASALPALALFLITTLLATYLMSACRPELLALAKERIPRSWQRELSQLGGGLKQALGGWLKAQLILMLITFGELAAGLFLLRVELALLLAGLVALLDALPVFGAAVVLVPWALGALLGGRILLGVGLLVLCGIVTLMRSLLEPRLVGQRVGLHPLAALAGMYVGFQAFGVAGMILAPLALVLAKQLWTCGVPQRLWSQI